MDLKTVISVKNVSKSYHVWNSPASKLFHLFFSNTLKLSPNWFGFSDKLNGWLGKRYQNFRALEDISFEIRKGESFGIVGLNGSGKSTLLQIIAGTLQPSIGSVKVCGRVAALLELGSGFDPEFTGRENVFLNAAILGVSKKEICERFHDIETFADIGKYIDQPVKTYSSGMMVRLAFAVQVQLEPDILIIDEALAVGDTLFQKRCFQHLDKMINAGVTLLFVSHTEEIVRTLTSRALLLKSGKLKSIGDSADIVREYQRQIHGEEEAYLNHINNDISGGESNKAGIATRSSDTRLSYGSKEVEIIAVGVRNLSKQVNGVFSPGDRMSISVRFKINERTKNLNIGLRIRNREGVKIYSWGTLNQDMVRKKEAADLMRFWDRKFNPGEVIDVTFETICRLGRNFYEVQVIATEEETLFYGNQRVLHWIDEAAFFQVEMNEREYFFGGINDMAMKAFSPDGKYN